MSSMPSPRPVVMVGLYGALREPDLLKFEPLPSEVHDARYWTLNDCWELKGVKWERIFQVHRNFEQLAQDRPSCYRDWRRRYNATGAQIVFGDESPIEGISSQMRYPWREAIAEFGLDYFQSSFNCMIALAIMEGVKSIYLRRVKLAVDEEYDTQARALLYAIYDAERRGVSIDCPWRGEWEARFNGDDAPPLPKLLEPYGRYQRKKSVAFVGLYTPDLLHVTCDDLRWNGADIWTLNDFYRVFNFAPDVVFNPCDASFKGHSEDASRFPGDWKDEYNKSGALIYTLGHVPGLRNQAHFDFRRGVEEFGIGFFTSTLSYMFAQAIWEGYREIRLYGVSMMDAEEHRRQVPGLLQAIDECRSRGIEVVAAYESLWRQEFSAVDWRQPPPSIVPYSHSEGFPSKLTVESHIK